MFSALSDVKEYISKEDVKALDLRYIDLNGRWRHVTLPASTDGLAQLEKGVGFDGSSVGYRKTHKSDMALLLPDLSTAIIDPFMERKTLGFICAIVEADSRESFSLDPRGVAKRAEEYLSQLKWVDTSKWGPELEFNLFDKVSFDCRMDQSHYQLLSDESAYGDESSGDGAKILPSDGYHAMPPTDRLHEFRSEIVAHLEAIGIEIKYHHHEGGGAGQVEIEVPMGGLLKTADNIMLIKYVAKMTARRWGKSVTFMPKPIRGDNGSGMHVHQNLWEGNRNLFYDSEGYSGLSDIALSYIAGLFEHAPALLAFTNPSTNSYRRLVPGFEAPTHLFFSKGNRTAAVRIPEYAVTEEAERIEFRTPDATSNIYFCLAAQLLAGIDGIEKKMNAADYGPIDEDIHTWSQEKINAIRALPTSLDQALKELRRDHKFLLQGNVFSQKLIDSWVEYKTRKETLAIQERPHPYEFTLYYDA